MTAEPDKDQAPASAFVHILVVEIELSDPASAPQPNTLGHMLVLVRLHGVPLDTLALFTPGAATGIDVHSIVLGTFEKQMARHPLTRTTPCGKPPGE